MRARNRKLIHLVGPRRGLLPTLAVITALMLATAPSVGAAAPVLRPNDPKVITDWNALGVSTIIGDASKKAPEQFLYVGFLQAAVYDAVIGIHGAYEPYSYAGRPDRPASAQAAAVAAAHRVLRTYSPYAQATLDARYHESLADIPDGRAKDNGVAYGNRVADHLIAQRAGDGRNAPITLAVTPAPGVWRPTPPANADMLVPWAAFVTPLMVESTAQFGHAGLPPALTSAQYTADFDEVKSLGSATGSSRSSEQTATAMFFSGSPTVQYSAALRAQVTARHLDLVDTARMFAAVTMSQADAFLSIWHAKYTYAFWRPITAIRLADTDGNPDTAPDPSWTPLLATPPYPEYVSGYTGVTGAFTRALAGVLGTQQIDADLVSTAVPGTVRHFGTEQALNQDVVDARVWLGIHFRTADVKGLAMGQQVADYALDHYFQPTDGR